MAVASVLFLLYISIKNKRDTEYYIAKKQWQAFSPNGDLTCNCFFIIIFFIVNISELGYDCSFEEHCFC